MVKSTLAAECLALHDGFDSAFYTKTIIQELLHVNIEIDCRVDNNPLVENVQSAFGVIYVCVEGDDGERRSQSDSLGAERKTIG